MAANQATQDSPDWPDHHLITLVPCKPSQEEPEPVEKRLTGPGRGHRIAAHGRTMPPSGPILGLRGLPIAVHEATATARCSKWLHSHKAAEEK